MIEPSPSADRAVDRALAAARTAMVHDDRPEDAAQEPPPAIFTDRQIFVLGAGFGAAFGFFCLVAAGVIALVFA